MFWTAMGVLGLGSFKSAEAPRRGFVLKNQDGSDRELVRLESGDSMQTVLKPAINNLAERIEWLEASMRSNRSS